MLLKKTHTIKTWESTCAHDLDNDGFSSLQHNTTHCNFDMTEIAIIESIDCYVAYI